MRRRRYRRDPVHAHKGPATPLQKAQVVEDYGWDLMKRAKEMAQKSSEIFLEAKDKFETAADAYDQANHDSSARTSLMRAKHMRRYAQRVKNAIK